MPPEKNDQGKESNVEIISIGDKKFTVTKQFKEAYEADVGAVKNENKTLKQKMEDLQASIGKNPSDDPKKDDDKKITFESFMDDPEGAIQRILQKTGVKQVNADEILQKVKSEQAIEKYFDAFYKEHKYFDRDKHDAFVKMATKNLYPQIKDLPAKEGREKVANYLAEVFGMNLKDLKNKGKSGGDPNPGVVLESGETALDYGEKGDNLDDKDKPASMAQIVKKRHRTRAEAQRTAVSS